MLRHPCVVLCVCLVAGLFSSCLFAAEPYVPVQVDPVQEPWRWAAFPELKGQGLRCMAEAADSSVWFGTDGGTMRYDGATWSSFSPEDGLLGAPVYTLCSMDNGDLYAGSEWGLSCFRNGRWQRVFPVGSQVLWPINDLQKGVDGSLWAATAWGALHFSQGDTVLYTTREMGQVVASLVPGLRLVYIPEGIVPTPDWWYPHWNVDGIGVRVIEGSWASLRSRNAPRMIWALAPGGPGEQAGLQIGDRILSVDGTPPAWTNDAFKGPRESEVLLTVERPGQQGVLDVRIRRRKVDGQYTECAVYSVHEDREGRVWFGMPHGEIVCFAPGEQEPWRVYGREQGLKIAYGPRVLQTQDRTVWAVGKNSEHQIYRLEGHVWETALAGRGDMVGTAILEAHNGALWVGGRGLRVLQHDEWHEISLPTMIPRHYMRLMQTSDGAIWIAGQGEEAVRLDYGTTRWTSYRGLLFECALEDGSLWFLSHHREVVRKQGASWLRYGVPDGLMGRPHTLIESRNGGVLALGYHQGQTALSRFDGTAWQTRTYAEIEMGDGAPQVFEDRDEHVWFSGKIGIWEARGFSDTTWKYHSLPEAPDFAKAVGQTSNGNIWVGGWYGLRRFDGNTWSVVSAPEGLQAYVDVLYEGLDGNLWVGTRLHGLFRFTGESWVSYSYRQGLADNHILGILQTIDGTVWAVTRQGVSRFDGRAWLTHALPPFFIGKIRERGLRSEKDGTLWINLGLGSDAGTVRYRPESRPPQTVITSSVDRVSQPGNTVISWQGSDPWRDTADDELQYAWRLDGGEWSEFTGEKSKVLFSLESGAHAFEVHARDRDFNVDPTPALVRFTVIAPVWRQGWFITLVIMFIGLIALQTKRVMRRDRRLLLQTSRLVSLGQMTAAVAHELNQPLAAISATAEGLYLRLEDGMAVARNRTMGMMGDILGLVERMSETIEHLRIFSRDTSAEPERRFQVNDVVRAGIRIIEAQLKSHGIVLKLELAEDLPLLTGHPHQIEQVLLNLLSNARDALDGWDPEGSGKAGRKQVEVRTYMQTEEGVWVVVEVADNGSGMSEASRARVFEPFFTTKTAERGTGIGLSISETIAQNHGGRLFCESQEGEGTVFRMFLPVTEEI